MSVVISVEGLSVRYNSLEVLRDISLSVNTGDYVALVGPNGSGKTTLIKTILGLVEPSKGSVSLFKSIPSIFQDWHKIGYIPQRLTSSNPYFPAFVKEIVAMGLLPNKKFPRMIKKADSPIVDNALSMLGILHLKNKHIGELSVGQQQRVLIARALINKPELLILDEPTVAIDPEMMERFFNILHELNRDKNTTIILVTHDIGSVGRYASRLLYLDKRVVFFGTFKDFCESEAMTGYFGHTSQHIICHRDDCAYRKGLFG